MSDRKYRHRGYMDDDGERQKPQKHEPGRRDRLEGAPRGRGLGLPRDVVFKCARCGKKIPKLGIIGEDASCPSCGEPLHTCTNCSFFDTAAPFECRKPIEARIESKSKANRCPHFSPKTVRDLSSPGPSTPDDARSAFDALFKKP